MKSLSMKKKKKLKVATEHLTLPWLQVWTVRPWNRQIIITGLRVVKEIRSRQDSVVNDHGVGLSGI